MASGQTVYLPVTYQYDASGQGNWFYYGGSDPLVFASATAASRDPSFGRSAGFAFHSSRRQVVNDGQQIYSDGAGPGVNVRRYGYTTSDARNAAYAAVPTYIRMSDQQSLATVLPDGTRVVAANTPGEIVRTPEQKTVAEKKPEARGVIIIVPKKNLAATTRPSAKPSETKTSAATAQTKPTA